MEYNGFFINLDRSTERRAAMEQHLAQYGLEKIYVRFPAAEGNSLNFPNSKILPGETGCFTSHYLLLKENIGRTVPLHVVEDDVLFSRFTASVIASLAANNSFATYDIVYLDTFVSTSNVLYKKYRELYHHNIRRNAEDDIGDVDFQLIDMKDVEFALTSSMVIAPQAISKLCELYAAELARGPEIQIDLFIRCKAKEGAIRVGCIFPFVTSVRLESAFDTTLGHPDVRLQTLVGLIARHMFFVEGDWDKCREYAQKYPSLPDDLQAQLLTHILGFSLDDRFRFN